MFITRGCCPAGGILSLYPGLVYDSRDVEEQQAASALADDAFAPTPPPWTADNHYLLALRCLGRSFLIDGRPFALSARLWRRAAAGVDQRHNDSWLPPLSAPWLPTAAVAEAAAAAGAVQSGAAGSGLQQGREAQHQSCGGSSSSNAAVQALMSQAALGERPAVSRASKKCRNASWFGSCTAPSQRMHEKRKCTRRCP